MILLNHSGGACLYIPLRLLRSLRSFRLSQAILLIFWLDVPFFFFFKPLLTHTHPEEMAGRVGKGGRNGEKGKDPAGRAGDAVGRAQA